MDETSTRIIWLIFPPLSGIILIAPFVYWIAIKVMGVKYRVSQFLIYLLLVWIGVVIVNAILFILHLGRGAGWLLFNPLWVGAIVAFMLIHKQKSASLMLSNKQKDD